MESNESTKQSTSARTSRGRGISKWMKTLSSRGALVILLILAIAAAAYFFNQDRNDKAKLKNPQAVAQSETNSLVSKVSQLAVLPTGESPTVYTVSDISKLKSQAFFANAQNGDKVLIYAQAKKAYLYRPGTNKLINVAPLSINTGSSTTKQ